MRFVVTLLLALVMTAHAALGCCWHHDHHNDSAGQTACCHHEHEHDSHSTPADHETPDSCDEESCVFVAHNSSAPSLDFLTALSSVIVCEFPCPSGSMLRTHYLAALDDVSFPSGPRLHLWQCVLVI
jgi:hypothetical protein